jgi:3-oxoacyl-[acyl-carrier-protein] synthase II
MDNLTPLWLLKFLPNMLGCHVTIVHDARAPSNTIPCGEASSHLAVGEAFRTIARGAADVCVCGGAESKMNPMGVMRQQLLGRLVTGPADSPATACRPFDPSVNGMIAAEGGGLLIIEEEDFARERGARIYGEIAGFGAAANVTSWKEPEPDGAGIGLAIRNALADAGTVPEEVDLICTFGSGINAYDASELAGIRQVFGDRSGIPAIAVKGSIGNNGAGSGTIDLSVAAMAMYHNTLPPSPNTEKADTGGCLKFVQDGPVDARIGTVLSVAYTLSGSQIAAVVLKKHES